MEFRADKTGIVHLPFGKANFSEEDLLINLLATVVSLMFVSLFVMLLFCEHNLFSDWFVNLAEICGNKQADWGERSVLEKRSYMFVNGAIDPVRHKGHA